MACVMLAAILQIEHDHYRRTAQHRPSQTLRRSAIRSQPHDMTARAAHAVGISEGVAIALGVTALELLDEIAAV
jgi:hypothetical protein